MAAEGGRVSTIQYLAPKMESLLQNTTNAGSSMLHLAAEAGHAEVVQLVIDDYKLNPTASNKVSEYQATLLIPLVFVKLMCAVCCPV